VTPPRLQTPPLSLYIHLPWCVAKCPYCDFNSHALGDELPEDRYIDALLADLEVDLPRVWGRTVQTVFLGGGTPSLFSAAAMDRLLSGVRARLPLAPDAEVTMEANPGAVEYDRFEAYRAAGINRISLGVQSFDGDQLKVLGRIHSRDEAHRAIDAIRQAGFDRFNLDLMWALPGQTVGQALDDLEQALSFEPEHLSHYQLTLEPNTVFAAHPPSLPDEDTVIDIQDACAERLALAGFEAYEISAWSRPGRASRHNLNYWRFGDYLGIGAGAHGKLTLPAEGAVRRTRRKSHPRPYLKALDDGGFIAEDWQIPEDQLAFEYFLNRTRLAAAINLTEFEQRTGLPIERIAPALDQAFELGLLKPGPSERIIQRTERGRDLLNDLQALFLPDANPVTGPGALPDPRAVSE
jgi:oxygen-independent coproporphyrinogen-3 oxidase